MSRPVTSNSGVNRPNTTPVSNAGAVNAVNSTDDAADVDAPVAEIQSASGAIIQPRPTEIKGLDGGATMTATNATNRFARDTSFDNYEEDGSSDKVDRGFIEPDVTSIPGGCRLQVTSRHAFKNSKVSLFLMAEVLDTKTNQLRSITLSRLTDNEDLCGDSFRGEHHFDIKYDDVNKYLQQFNPNLQVNPGNTKLAVIAHWEGGHQAGGFGRGGTFRLPQGSSTPSLISIRNANRADSDEPDLPLDMQVAYPSSLVGDVPALKPDGNIVSRLESELKGEASKEDMTAAVTEMYKLAAASMDGDHSGIEKLVGKDWEVHTVNRYWLKDDGVSKEGEAGTGFFKGFRVDDDGLPLQDPMRDSYMDDTNLGMTREEGALRLRKNAQATVFNVKPGGGRRDDRTAISQRVEVGLEMKPNTTSSEAGEALRSLSSGRWSGTVFNHAQKQVHELDGDLKLSNSLNPWLDVTQDRHKFTLAHKNGVEIELSFDKVMTKTTRANLAQADGSPRTAEFYVLEAELDHLQLESTNSSNYAAGETTTSSTFKDESGQQNWLKSTGSAVTMDIDPRLHELNDLNNSSFRTTTSYKTFESATQSLLPKLFPKGLGHGRQKAAAAAEKMGLVHFDDKAFTADVQSAVEDAGFKWTAEMDKALTEAMGDEVKQKALTQLFLSKTPVSRTLGTALGIKTDDLEYDVPKAKQRVIDSLVANGYESTPEIDKMLDGLDPKKVTPGIFEQTLTQIATNKDADALKRFADELGVSPVPAPALAVENLFGDAAFGAVLQEQMKKGVVDESSLGDIEKFLRLAAKNGAEMFEVRTTMSTFGQDPEGRLTWLAKQAGIEGKEPKLAADFGAVVANAAKKIQGQSHLMDAPLEKFLGQYAAKKTRAETVKFAGSLSSNAQTKVDAAAKELGVEAPKLAWNIPAIRRTLSTTAASYSLNFGANETTFLKSALDEGLTVRNLTSIMQKFSTHLDFKSAFKAANVDVPAGLSLPKAEFDVPGVNAKVMARMGSWSSLVDVAKLDDFIGDCMKAGVTPYQITSYAYNLIYRGNEYAERYLPANADKTKVPKKFQTQLSGFMTQWDKFNTKLSPEQKTFIEDNWDAVEQHDEFEVQKFFKYNRRDYLLSAISKMSGVKQPDYGDI